MFSLKQKMKKDPTQLPKKDKPINEVNKTKNQSKKISKTVFEDPFRYRIELLPEEESQQVEAYLISYLNSLREKIPCVSARQGIIKTIKFQREKSLKPKLSPITCQQFRIGIKRTKNILYRNHKGQTLSLKPQITIIFYQQKKHDILQQLLVLLKITNQPYLILRENHEINRLLGIRTTSSICLLNQQFSHHLLKFVGRSAIDVPWVLDMAQIIEAAWRKNE